MTLTKNEREQLLEFIKLRYIDYHDIRLLIAKDLEDDITKQMKEEETLSFEDALEQAYKKYGVIGFSDASEKYMKKIRKHSFKFLLEVVKAELSTVKFWLYSSLFFIGTYTLLLFLDLNPYIYAGGFLVVLILGLIFSFSKLHKHIKEQKKKESFYYFDEVMLSNNSILFPAIYLPLASATNLWWVTNTPALSMAILALSTTISYTAIYLFIFSIYQKRQNIINTYRSNYLLEKTNYNLNLI
jgi:hypothetical protein